ncbi:glucan endo-1,3-beta-glucosidase-like protein [Musa troglodytarum]|uniref:Glucan endo-1,3-beta-glucosidase-like protein n=1 Tax=Musa troglodytarum TaxID=320322 RepID=A0A9E7FK56_9LILI|nr:glucan endo-1,3-beta-glucosidase-like protein [Musa troglodytarum]
MLLCRRHQTMLVEQELIASPFTNKMQLCWNPNTVRAHCSYAANSYFQRKGQAQGACDFSGTAALTTTDPMLQAQVLHQQQAPQVRQQAASPLPMEHSEAWGPPLTSTMVASSQGRDELPPPRRLLSDGLVGLTHSYISLTALVMAFAQGMRSTVDMGNVD